MRIIYLFFTTKIITISGVAIDELLWHGFHHYYLHYRENSDGRHYRYTIKRHY